MLAQGPGAPSISGGEVLALCRRKGWATRASPNAFLRLVRGREGR